MRMSAIVLLCTLSAPCLGGESEANTFEAEATERLGQLKQQLMQTLKQSLQQGHPAAIEQCRIAAPAIAAGLSDDQWAVGRSSERLRNPANAPAPWLSPLLEAYQADPDQGPRSLVLEDGRHAYVEAIAIKPLCLGCHGEQLSAPVASSLQALYPSDRATGYRPGDFRGLFWVTYRGD